MPGERWSASARRNAADAAVVVAAIGVLVLAQVTGASARAVLPERRDLVRPGPEEVLEAWRGAGVRGRVLVHVAREAGLTDGPGPATADGFVARAISEGIVRRVEHVVPEAAWPEVEANLRAIRGVAAQGPAFRVAWRGTPIVISRVRDLAARREPVLVDVEAGRFSEAELAALAARLRGGDPAADLVVTWGPGPALPGAGR